MRYNAIISITTIIVSIGLPVFSAPIAYTALERRIPGGIFSSFISQDDNDAFDVGKSGSLGSSNRKQQTKPISIKDNPKQHGETVKPPMALYKLPDDDPVTKVEQLGFGAYVSDLYALFVRAIGGDELAIETLHGAARRDAINPKPGATAGAAREVYKQLLLRGSLRVGHKSRATIHNVDDVD
ncbi:hypothetical protein FRB95_007754 [Tulasnella sp. JGI-2019a]|nr:hypothetical protein FRB95_007754 [Tulasnella sp. JGI-2019a]